MKISRKQFIQSTLLTAGAAAGLQGCADDPPDTPGAAGGTGGGATAGSGGTPAAGTGGGATSGTGGTPSAGTGGTPSAGTGGTPAAGTGGTPAGGSGGTGGSGGGGGTGGAGDGCETPTGTVAEENGHDHEFAMEVTMEQIMAAEEVEYTLDQNGHTHTVTLTPADFMMLQQGMTVEKESGDTNGHTHPVTVSCGA